MKAKQKLAKHVKQLQEQNQHFKYAGQRLESVAGASASASVQTQPYASLQVSADSDYAMSLLQAESQTLC